AALKLIVKYSDGIPRRINVLCHNALLTAFSEAAHQVTPPMVQEAHDDYEDIIASRVTKPPRGSWLLQRAPAVGLAALVVGTCGVIAAKAIQHPPTVAIASASRVQLHHRFSKRPSNLRPISTTARETS